MRENARQEFDKKLGCGGNSSSADVSSLEVMESCEGTVMLILCDDTVTVKLHVNSCCCKVSY